MSTQIKPEYVIIEKSCRVDGLVSIIMPAHNAKEFIRETIDSIIAQSYENWELLIVDDCSTDGTIDFLKSEFSSLGSKLKVFSLEINSGASVARNKAIAESQGQFVAFLDCDDLWLPNKLERQLEFMRENKAPFTFTSFNKVNEKGEIVGKVDIPGNRDKVFYQELLKANIVQCSTVIYDTSELGIVTMPLIRRRQDFGLWLKLLKLTPFGMPLREHLTSYRVRSDSLSSNKWISVQYTWKIYREVEKIPLLKALWFFGNYLIRTIIKYQKAKT